MVEADTFSTFAAQHHIEKNLRVKHHPVAIAPLRSRTTSCKGAHCQSSLSWSVDPPCCPNVHSMWGLRPHSSKQKVPTLYPILNTYSYTSSVCKCSRSRFVFRGRSRWHLIRLRYYSVLPFFYVFRRWLVGLSSVFLFLRVFK